jgi:peroxiredoxin
MRALFVGAALLLALVGAGVEAAAQGGAATLRGQVVCSECWFEQTDRKANPYGTESDLKCAVRCSKADVPQALAVWDGDRATLYLLENGAFTKEGKDFLAFAGKEVEVAGATRAEGDKRLVKVDALKVISDGPAAAAAGPAPALGTDAPAVSLPDLSGQEQSLAGYKGKIVVLNFWATWCAPCRKEMPAFVNIQNEYAAWGVQVVAASADTEEARGQVVKFVREHKLGFPVWTGATREHMLAFGLGEELPGTAVIDRDGKVVARFKGMIKEADLKKVIDGLLEQQHSRQESGEGGGPVDADRHDHGEAGAPIAVRARGKSSVPA